MLRLTEEQEADLNKLATIKVQETSWGGKVFIILPKTTINAQELAMIQSLYSRDPQSIINHLLQVAASGAEKFMSTFYVGYGHKSIGDCGSVTLAFEGVSMLAAKAIQDFQLYCGQEASTRYMKSFATQLFLLALGHQNNQQLKAHQETLRTTYLELQGIVEKHLKNIYPLEDFPTTSEQNWLKAINARKFDITRSWLPAGCTTNLSAYLSLSTAAQLFSKLLCHPLDEVREIAQATLELLRETYPSSFREEPLTQDAKTYLTKYFADLYYNDGKNQTSKVAFTPSPDGFALLKPEEVELLKIRPKGQEIPIDTWEDGEINVHDYLDFGSFRDLQRHRPVVQKMPLLTDEFGFEDWYFKEMPEETATAHKEMLKNYLETLNELCASSNVDAYEKQYMLPMGMKIPIAFKGTLSKVAYIVELRAQGTVHPTLHALAYKWGEEIKTYFENNGCGFPLYTDSNIGLFSLKRGTQDIVKKTE